MNKKALRALYRQKRAAIPPEQQAQLSQQIAQQALRLPIWDKQVFYHLFWRSGYQLSYSSVTRARKNAGRLPYCNEDGTYGTFFI